MKNIFKSGLTVAVFAFILSGCEGTKEIAQNPGSISVSYQTFYDDLSPYGTWIDYPAYGHVWHPNVDGDFRPYLTNGYWNYSNEGWLWMSNYNWGWAPFHYGRWAYDDMYGWLWIPGYEWSPAWVTWGNVDDYYAWAPLMPEVNVGIQFGLWRPHTYYWNVCRRNHIYDRDISNVVERRENVENYANRINIINNFSTTRLHNNYYAKGPEINEVEKFTNRKIEPVTIHDINNRAAIKQEGNQIHVYRPTVINPQPRQFRRVDGNANPVRNNGDKIINTEHNRQRENIDRLPVHKAPAGIITRGQGNKRGGGGGRKNQRN
jgi:hypothetical protein